MLPPTETFIVTAILIGTAIFIFLACGVFMGYAAAQLQPTRTLSSASTTPRIGHFLWYLLGLIAVWYAIALATSAAGLISFTYVLPFTLFPIIVGTLLSFTPPLRDLIKAIPTHWLIFLQFYRVVGGIFIYPYFTAGLLTQGFALNAGIGDIITGVLALPVAWLVWRDGKRYTWLFVAWTAFGILDLIVAPASAAYFGFAANDVVPTFPITIIPLFLGPAFGILIHIITLRSFYLRYVSDKSLKHAAANTVQEPS